MTTFGFALNLYYFTGSLFFVLGIFLILKFVTNGGLKTLGRGKTNMHISAPVSK